MLLPIPLLLDAKKSFNKTPRIMLIDIFTVQGTELIQTLCNPYGNPGLQQREVIYYLQQRAVINKIH